MIKDIINAFFLPRFHQTLYLGIGLGIVIALFGGAVGLQHVVRNYHWPHALAHVDSLETASCWARVGFSLEPRSLVCHEVEALRARGTVVKIIEKKPALFSLSISGGGKSWTATATADDLPAVSLDPGASFDIVYDPHDPGHIAPGGLFLLHPVLITLFGFALIYVCHKTLGRYVSSGLTP